MKKDFETRSLSFRIASAAILTAVVALMTLVVRIPVGPTRGYLNLGDMAIFFSALTFGPVTAFIAGGLGTAMADIISGYSQWAPFSFLIHGLQGLAVGYIVLFFRGENRFSLIFSRFLAFLAGTVIMAGGYFLAGSIMVGAAAAAVEIPMNILQNAVGTVGGLLLSSTVAHAYPPVVNYKW